MKTQASVIAALLATLLCTSPSLVGAAQLLKEFPSSSKKNTEFANIASFKGTTDVVEVKMNVDEVTIDQKELTFELYGQAMKASVVRTEQITNPDKDKDKDQSQSIVWYGNLEHHRDVIPANAKWQDPLNAVTLVKHNNTITGTIRRGKAIYQLRPFGADRHLAISLDASKMPPEEEPVDKNLTAKAAHLPPSAPTQADHELTDIDVMTVVPHKVQQDYQGDMYALMNLAVALANQSYINSNIGINLRLAAYMRTDYVPSTSSPDIDLRRLVNPSDGHMDEAHAVRDSAAADVVVYITFIDHQEICGRAQGNGVTKENAFAYVNANCVPIFTFAHEIGHLQSARHEIESDPTPTPFPFGHGYRFTAAGAQWTTMMGTRNSPATRERLNLWSNPDLSYEGVPIGNRETADTHRVLELTKETVSKFREAVAK